MKHGFLKTDGITGTTAPGQQAASRPQAWAEPAGRLAGLLALGLALDLYRAQPELGFAVLCGTSAATGWLLSRRAVALIGLAEAGVLVACVWLGTMLWLTAAIQLAVALALGALAALAAEGAVSRHANAEQERRLQGVTFLLETAQFLASSRDQGVILNTAVQASARGISRSGKAGAAHASFHEVAGEQARIALVVDEPRHQVLATGFEYPLERNQAARAAIRTGRPAIVRPDHLTGNLRGLAEELGWQVLIMAPVYAEGSLRGLLAATARDGPAVEQLQQFMLDGLARFTSASLASAAARQPAAAPETRDSNELFDGSALSNPGDDFDVVQAPTEHQLIVVGNFSEASGGPEAAGSLEEPGDVVSKLATHAPADVGSRLLSREHGLAALEQDVRQFRRAQARGHCLAVLRVPASEQANSGGELIRLVGDRLRSYLRRDDLIFRYSDDEIVCSFGDIDARDVQTILNRVQSDLAREVGYVPFAIGLTSVASGQPAS